MSFSLGIVGLPNVGKSTLFNALLKKQTAEASNYPFCTIDPNVGIVEVPDERLEKLSNLDNPTKIIPTAVEFYDIAGLVKGAHKGEGLGNAFLSHIREVDAIIHVVRYFADSNITHVHGDVNPSDDIETIEAELLLADLHSCEKSLEKASKQAKSQDKEWIIKRDVLQTCFDELTKETPLRDVEFDSDEAEIVRQYNFLTRKPLMYVLNVSEDQLTEDITFDRGNYVVISAAVESELVGFDADEAAEYMKEIGIEEPGLHKLIKEAYSLLGLISFFTSGEKETRAWTVRNGAKAPEAAGVIHTDFEEKFIRAEVVSYTDYVTAGGFQKARDAGKMRVEGKDYVVVDGDVMYFRTGA